MVAVSDFSGLTSSAWALAKAEASAATVSLDRGMGRLRLQHIKAHRPGFRAPGFHAVPDRLPGILRYQGFELAFRPFVVEKGARVLRKSAANSAQEFDALISTMRMASMRGARRLGIDEVRNLAGLDAAPEFLFRRDQDAEVERVHGDRDLDPLAAAGDNREHRGPEVGDPHVVLDLSHILFGGGLLGE